MIDEAKFDEIVQNVIMPLAEKVDRLEPIVSQLGDKSRFGDFKEHFSKEFEPYNDERVKAIHSHYGIDPIRRAYDSAVEHGSYEGGDEEFLTELRSKIAEELKVLGIAPQEAEATANEVAEQVVAEETLEEAPPVEEAQAPEQEPPVEEKALPVQEEEPSISKEEWDNFDNENGNDIPDDLVDEDLRNK